MASAKHKPAAAADEQDEHEAGGVVAFAYDNATTGSDAPVMFGVIPGEWMPGVAVLPDAFGMTVTQMRDAIRDYSLPISEVRVAEKDALAKLPTDPTRFESETEGTRFTARPDDHVLQTKNGPIPAPVHSGSQPPLQPLTAAMQARDTVLSRGGSLQEAADAAREAGGEAGEGIAAVTEIGAERAEEAQAAFDAAGATEEPGAPAADSQAAADAAGHDAAAGAGTSGAAGASSTSPGGLA